MSTQLYVVDDDEDIREMLRRYLSTHGYDVSVFEDGRSLMRKVTRQRPDLIVLDLMMPGMTGIETLRRLRATDHDVPVLILTARADATDCILGLQLGADDYLPKPFNPRELLARIHAVLRRQRNPATGMAEHQPVFRFGHFTLDLKAKTLNRDDACFPLSHGEFALLKVFVNAPMRTLSRERLLTSLHGAESEVSDRGIDVRIYRLRRLVETDPTVPRFIQTVRGCGYIFVPNGEAHLPAR